MGACFFAFLTLLAVWIGYPSEDGIGRFLQTYFTWFEAGNVDVGVTLRADGLTDTDFRGPLRSGASDEEIAALIGEVWTGRADRYSEIRTAETTRQRKVEMSYIGG